MKKDIFEIVVLIVSLIAIFGGIMMLYRGVTTAAIIGGIWMLAVGLFGGAVTISES